ncbi:Rox3-domain-containing protein [Delitschia confertaspora ATCC 74209]|uniref:Mediator of RNA polymerase II transcription subunit 19 n=1 Tax=Delitschia confertaspora ATCC 74209 TaxID=1513339 RepID=A0A9P4JI49_9PLEO|nr:Rox3-domain-containing protein [Delitschia confertaspora ATCC 74209]
MSENHSKRPLPVSDSPSKRQRLTGSFSPASPPYHLAKPVEHTKPIVSPNTPTSPPYMSSASQATGASGRITTAPPSEMTPPSSVHLSQQPSQLSSSATNPLPLPTPANSTGKRSCTNNDSDGDAMMVDGSDGATMSAGSVHRSDHDWQSSRVLPLLKLCQSPHPMMQPHPSQNLNALYCLQPLARSVARNDPVTGEKINKLRKSYEGMVKNFQIPGKARPIKMEGVFMQTIAMPDEEYEVQKVRGKGTKSNILALLDRSVGKINPGPLPPKDAQHFRQYISNDDGIKSKVDADIAGRKGMQSLPSGRNSAVPSPALRASRPERQGSKRRYNDGSFVGYSEGFMDDAESTAGEDDRSGFPKKKKRKV